MKAAAKKLRLFDDEFLPTRACALWRSLVLLMTATVFGLSIAGLGLFWKLGTIILAAVVATGVSGRLRNLRSVRTSDSFATQWHVKVAVGVLGGLAEFLPIMAVLALPIVGMLIGGLGQQFAEGVTRQEVGSGLSRGPLIIIPTFVFVFIIITLGPATYLVLPKHVDRIIHAWVRRRDLAQSDAGKLSSLVVAEGESGLISSNVASCGAKASVQSGVGNFARLRRFLSQQINVAILFVAAFGLGVVLPFFAFSARAWVLADALVRRGENTEARVMKSRFGRDNSGESIVEMNYMFEIPGRGSFTACDAFGRSEVWESMPQVQLLEDATVDENNQPKLVKVRYLPDNPWINSINSQVSRQYSEALGWLGFSSFLFFATWSMYWLPGGSPKRENL